MKRQLRKVIFLPANEITLNNIGRTYLPQYYTMKREWDYYQSWWHKLRNKKSRKKIEITRLKQLSRYETDTIWDVAAYCQNYGYEIILYPEIVQYNNVNEFEKKCIQLKEQKLAFAFLSGNELTDFQKAINDYDINPHNSILVSRDYGLIEKIIKVYYPHNAYSSGLVLDRPLGFNFVYWHKKVEERDKYYIKSNEDLIDALTHPSNVNDRYFSCSGQKFMEDKVVYIGGNGNIETDNFVRDNYEWIQQQAGKKGCTFVFLPHLLKHKINQKVISKYIQYHYPSLPAEHLFNFGNVQHSLTPEMLQDLFLAFLNLPAIKAPALLRNMGSMIVRMDNEYSLFPIIEDKSIKEQFEFYFHQLQFGGSAGKLFYSLGKKSDHDKVDERFSDEAQKLTEDVIKTIEWLKQEGLNSMLAEIALRLSDGDPLAVQGQLKTDDGKLEIKTHIAPALSRLRIEWTSKFDFQILLPDYGNLVVEMPRLPKALFYFFLQHPEGVMLNSLADYKDELLAIYKRVSNKTNQSEIERNIERLVDPFDNSVNVNCSRIKNAFVKLIDDQLAQNYYITGYRGEPKKITLLPTSIEIVGAFAIGDQYQ